MSSELAGLGRRQAPDPRDLAHRLPQRTSALRGAGKRRRVWWSNQNLDQGPFPHCVAYAGAHWLMAGPVTNSAPMALRELYQECQRLDEWPGENYDGTSVRALMKVLQRVELIGEYVWAYDVETVGNFILTKGPMVVGTEWMLGMCSLGRGGFVDLSGGSVGGHAWVVIGYDADRKCPDGTVGAFRGLNSWGRNWGDKGRFWISKGDFQTLLDRHGEAVTSTEIKRIGSAKIPARV